MQGRGYVSSGLCVVRPSRRDGRSHRDLTGRLGRAVAAPSAAPRRQNSIGSHPARPARARVRACGHGPAGAGAGYLLGSWQAAVLAPQSATIFGTARCGRGVIGRSVRCAGRLFDGVSDGLCVAEWHLGGVEPGSRGEPGRVGRLSGGGSGRGWTRAVRVRCGGVGRGVSVGGGSGGGDKPCMRGSRRFGGKGPQYRGGAVENAFRILRASIYNSSASFVRAPAFAAKTISSVRRGSAARDWAYATIVRRDEQVSRPLSGSIGFDSILSHTVFTLFGATSAVATAGRSRGCEPVPVLFTYASRSGGSLSRLTRQFVQTS